jgi:hypothetical protein
MNLWAMGMGFRECLKTQNIPDNMFFFDDVPFDFGYNELSKTYYDLGLRKFLKSNSLLVRPNWKN